MFSRVTIRSSLFCALFLVILGRESAILTQFIYQYVNPQLSSGFLFEHFRHYSEVSSWRISFFLHAMIGSLLLFSGLIAIGGMILPFSLAPKSLQSKIHRWCGKIYAGCVLGIAAPTGFIMSFYALGGWWARTAFLILSVLWFTVTWLGYRAIREKRIHDHSYYMLWSFFLACAALLQRRLAFLLTYYFAYTSGPNPQLVYILSAWGGWVFMTIFMHFLLRTRLVRIP